MRRYKQFLEEGEDQDPLSGLVNLFDIALVFSVALMAALITYLELGELLFSPEFTLVKNPGKDDMEIVVKDGEKITTYQAEEARAQSGTKGQRVCTAYKLESGDIIYVPD
jgi:hypothetical protein